ncbi:transcription-repair coupling factor [Candidatus Chrysopegis kryptomonas]|uniref:Transcription-repair-coupling factor n=1 Tax=Candidatus Chryseopegocella kryptomonas TaxID=1633643 RepID=A0A0P1MS05_9BACT|nr:transcription-repair coupling factor [Candidatus Chrysopegis kryptomonas]CUS98568.1 transcription-repair coupling factor (superfamily II helicase) [Candidatus Chrysopegis kryptomonas]
MKFIERVFQIDNFVELGKFFKGGGEILNLKNVAGSLFGFIVAYAFEMTKDKIMVVVQDEEFGRKIADDLGLIIGEENVFEFIPEEDMLADDVDVLKLKFAYEYTQGRKVFIVSLNQLEEEIPLSKELNTFSFVVSVGEKIGYEKLLSYLARNGFERKKYVESRGDYSVRGSIVDVFGFTGEFPLRIEFFDNEIASIREFDIFTQRSLRNLNRAVIMPKLFEKGLTSGAKLEMVKVYETLDDSICIVEDKNLIVQSLDEDIFNGRKFKKFINVLRLEAGEFDGELIDWASKSQPFFNSSITLFSEEVLKLLKNGFDIFLLCEGIEQVERMRELLEETIGFENVGKIIFEPRALNFGFILTRDKVAILTEHEIFNRIKSRNFLKYRKFKGITLHELDMLKPGDFVVHVDYGIGKFAGLQKIKVNGIEQEAVRLEYADDGVLYVNLNYINRIKKYRGEEGILPKLNKLGSGEWEKLKERTKDSIKKVARDLIWLYAKRSYVKGFRFSPDNYLQKEMEASFIYEDTPDQKRATIEVKQDMESDKPMDRLICGDVGFGKTEVAIRASFKAVLDKKQVAVLVPTTILAHQHYKTFTERLKNYPVRVEVLSRLVPKSKQLKIIEDLQNGEVDIIIGTHRLLSNDIRFKDLGLLIIDEEHRFGVEAKEKLRKMKVNVDTLTLSATPIPRTLYFSLMGARDMSIINTPPPNRLPIITKIISIDSPKFKDIVRNAIYFEVSRGGQVYFVVDKIAEIEDIAKFLKEIVPDLKFDIVHGKMKPSAIERVMLKFLEQKFDILISTKIIEAGIDIPNVNTIFIYNAHTFGLAEIYQLRGRVGRSNRQAYAYLLIPPVESIGTNAIRRLSAIEEFTELGSGLNLALKDMEIRGIGNLFGKEQTGFINSIGFDLYCRILEEAIEELKEQEFKDIFKNERKIKKKFDAIVSADVSAFIPDYYVDLDSERFNYYQKLYDAEDLDEIDAIREELEDRFGKIPDEVENLILISKVKCLAEKCEIQRVEVGRENVVVVLRDEVMNSEIFKEIVDVFSRGSSLKFEKKGKETRLVLKFRYSTSVKQNLVKFFGLLEELMTQFSDNERHFATNP